MDPFAQYAMVVADEAVTDANLPLTELDPDRVGVIWGSGIGGLLTFQEEMKLQDFMVQHYTHKSQLQIHLRLV